MSKINPEWYEKRENFEILFPSKKNKEITDLLHRYGCLHKSSERVGNIQFAPQGFYTHGCSYYSLVSNRATPREGIIVHAQNETNNSRRIPFSPIKVTDFDTVTVSLSWDVGYEQKSLPHRIEDCIKQGTGKYFPKLKNTSSISMQGRDYRTLCRIVGADGFDPQGIVGARVVAYKVDYNLVCLGINLTEKSLRIPWLDF